MHYLQPAHARSRIVQSNPFFTQKSNDTLFIKYLFRTEKVILVIKENEAENTPHIILQVGIKKSILQRFFCGGKLPNISKTAFSGRKGSSG